MAALISIIYGRIGIKDGKWKKGYIGQAGNGPWRVVQHRSAQVKAEVAGIDCAMLIHQEFAECDEDYFFPLLRINTNGVTSAEVAQCLNFWEQALCWGLGAMQLSQPLLDVRVEYDLPRLPFLRGANAIPCLSGSLGDHKKRVTCTA